MKNTITILFILFCSFCAYGQSVSASKILNFLNMQNSTEIGENLKQVGFKFKGKSNFDGFTEYSYYKIGRYGLEKFNVTFNDEIFTISYKTSPEAFLGYKLKLLSDDFAYAYEFKNNKYYENGNMRIGINENSSIISLFVKLQ